MHKQDLKQFIFQGNRGNITINVPLPEEISFPYYDNGLNYIERYVTTNKDDIGASRLFDLSHEESLLDYIEENPRVVILGGAGIGKTTELKSIYNKVLERGVLHPFYIELKNFKTGDSILVQKPEIKAFNSEEIIVFIDGLDEPKQIQNVVGEILAFANNQVAGAKIVVSCRTNVFPKSLKGFKPCYLKLLSYQQIEKYLRQRLQINPDTLLNEISRKGLFELVKIPFYLERIIEYYEKNNRKIPEDRAILFQFLVDKSIDTRFLPITSLSTHQQPKHHCLNLVKKLAFYMQCLGASGITSQEVLRVIGDDGDKDLLQKSSSLLSVVDDNWSFFHLNFQEYLAASIITKMPFTRIKELIGIRAFKYRRINPKWVNTLSFIFALLDSDKPKREKLADWLRRGEPHFLLSFEVERLPKEFREKAFIELLEYYISEDSGLDYRYEVGKLIKFARTDNALNYLLDGLSGINGKRSQDNILQLLEWATLQDIPTNFRNKLKQLLWSIIVNTDNDFNLIRNTLSIYSRLFKVEKVEVDLLFEQYFNKSPSEFKQALLSIASKENFCDSFIDSMIFYLKEQVGKDSFYHLDGFSQDYFEKLETKESILKYLDFYQEHLEFDNNYNFKSLNTISFQKAIKLVPKDGDILIIIDKIMAKIVGTRDYYNRREPILEYLTKTGRKFEMFQGIYQNMKEVTYDIADELAIIADEEGIEYLSNEFNDKNTKQEDIEIFQRSLYHFNMDLLTSFNKFINKNRTVKIPITRYMSKEEIEKIEQARVNKIKSYIFNKENYIAELELIFGTDEKLTKKMLSEKNRENREKKCYAGFLINGLYHMGNNYFVVKSTLLDRIENHWDCCHSIEEIIRFLRQNKEVELESHEMDFIKTWCDKEVMGADFSAKPERTVRGEGLRWREACLFYLITRFEFIGYGEDFYLGMLQAQFNPRDRGINIIEFVEKIVGVPIDKIKERVVQNVKNGIRLTQASNAHFEFCIMHDLESILPFLPPLLLESWRWNRGEVLDTYIKLGGDLEEIESVLEEIEDEDIEFRLTIIRRLVTIKSPNIESILIEYFHQNTGDIKEVCAKHLVNLENTTGLKFLREKTEETQVNLFNRVNRNINWKNTDALIELLHLFNFGLKKTDNQEFRDLAGFAKDSLYNLIIANPEKFDEFDKRVYYHLAVKKISRFFTPILPKKFKSSTSRENIEVMQNFWDDIKFQHYANQTLKIEEIELLYNVL